MRYIHLFFLLILVTSCGTKEEKQPSGSAMSKKNITSFSGVAMTIPYHIEIGEVLSEKESSEIEHLLDQTFQEVNALYNKYNSQSEISLLNNLEAYKKVIISHQLASFLKRCDFFVHASFGQFDPTIEPVQKLWKTYLEKGEKPPQDKVEALRAAVGWHNIHIENCTFYKDHDETQIDLGCIAKGHTVDLLTERIIDLGYENVFVEWGGDARASGKHPQGRSWAVYVSNLNDLNPDNALAYIPLQNQGIATSGDYLQQWTIKENGAIRTYFHLFDPHTLEPLYITTESIASSTCLTSNCTTADVIASVLLMSPNLAKAKILAQNLKQAIPNSAFWLISRKEIEKEPPPQIK